MHWWPAVFGCDKASSEACLQDKSDMPDKKSALSHREKANGMLCSPSSVMLKKFSLLLLVFVSEFGVVLDDELTAA